MENQKIEREVIKGILLSVLLVVIGHMIGQMFTDNFYFDGFKPTRKKVLAPNISKTRVITL